MLLWVRKFCVAMLALAVLAAPCLSTIDMFKAGSAHAQHASRAHHSPDAGTANQKHYSAHDDYAHEHGQATVVFTSDQQPGPERELASCCRLCDGWLTKRTADDRQAIQQAAPVPDRESGKYIVAVPVIALGVRPPDRLCTDRVAADPAQSATIPVYALTQRFRI